MSPHVTAFSLATLPTKAEFTSAIRAALPKEDEEDEEAA